jgi:radical SAM superfamily enzyme YgiQ (UPF0313 family)
MYQLWYTLKYDEDIKEYVHEIDEETMIDVSLAFQHQVEKISFVTEEDEFIAFNTNFMIELWVTPLEEGDDGEKEPLPEDEDEDEDETLKPVPIECKNRGLKLVA